jgi:archaellum component FlaC
MDVVEVSQDVQETYDEKRRRTISEMSTREIQEEQLAILRATQDLVENFFNQMADPKSGMGKMMKMFGMSF